jgi:hypothetical protein
MPDTITAKNADSKFKTHDTGQFVGQCVDTIDLGEKVESFPGTPDKLAHKCAIVFRTGERNEDTGEYIDISREFTVSMGDLANLRKFLEQWRGKPYTPDEIEQGVPLHKLAGNHGLLTIAHRTSGKGKVYANVTACVGVPKQMRSSLVDYMSGYERAEYWETRKKEYAEGAKKFRAENGAPSNGEFDDFPAASTDEDDDLPF